MQYQPPSSRLPRRAIALLAALIMTLGLLSAVRPLTPTAHADAATTDGEFVPLWTAPLLETKTGIGTPGGAVQKVPAGGTMTFQALGQGGLPASGVSAASLKVHAVTPSSTGFLSVYPSDKPTTISTVSFTTGESSTNADFTQITATGQITVANTSGQPVDVLVSVDGYFKSGGAATTVYKPLTTAVLWDTRAEFATGSPEVNTPLPAWSSTEVQVAGQAGIPTQCDQSAAVALNIVALNQSTDGELKVEPTDAPIGVGTLQFTANDWNNSTFSVVQMSCSGKLRVTNSSPGTVNVSISVRGYFTYWDADDRGARYKSTEPATILDTAAGTGTGGATTPMNGESHLVFDATGPSGVPVNTVSAVAMQIKIVNPTAGGWITFRPEDQPEIPISSLVYQQGENASGFETQIPSGLGRIAITNHGTASIHVQITVRGFYIHKTVEVIEGEEALGTQPTKDYQDAVAENAADDRATGSDTLGPSSYDPVTGTLITTATTTEGLVEASQPVQVPATAPDMGVGDGSVEPVELAEGEEAGDPTEPEPAPQMVDVTPRAVLSPNSSLSLDGIQEEILTLDSTQLPGADAIKGAFVQPEKNRVVVAADAAPAGLIDALTTRYGPSKVALVHQPGLTVPEPAVCQGAGSRDCVGPGTSWPKLRGGAKIFGPGGSGCTAGFNWKVGGSYYVLTAGHCINGYGDGIASSGNAVFANVVNFNYQNNKSVKRNGSGCCPPQGPRYSGDLAFAQMILGAQSAAAEIFVGQPGSRKRARVVDSTTGRRAQWGDKVCVGGAYSGSSCGWIVIEERYGWKNGLREVVMAYKKYGQCIRHGDSGGPVYTVKNGNIKAWGIIYGGTTSGYDDCYLEFTNIAEARWLGNGDVYGK